MVLGPKYIALCGSVVALTACGQSEFRQQIAAICTEQANSNRDCNCIADRLDTAFPGHLKPAFVALRWPLRPAPEDRDSVNGAMLRQAGIDPADRHQMDLATREFRDVYNPLREQLRNECGGAL